MTPWRVIFTEAAKRDLRELDNSVRTHVSKAIYKVAYNPLPRSEGGLGMPLGSHATGNLTHCCKIKLKKAGLRVVYTLVRQETIMRIIVISIRDDSTVYKMAQARMDDI